MASDIWQRTTQIVEKKTPLPTNGLLFPINSKGAFICSIRIAYTTAFVTPVVEHWLE